MGSAASTNSQESSEYMTDCITSKNDSDRRKSSSAKRKRKRLNDKKHQKRHRKDTYSKRKKKYRSRKVLNDRRNGIRSSTRNLRKDLPPLPATLHPLPGTFAPKSDMKKIKYEGKIAKDKKQGRLSSNNENIDGNNEITQTKINRDENKDNLIEDRGTKLYDLTSSEKNRIYDLRTLYSAVNKPKSKLAPKNDISSGDKNEINENNLKDFSASHELDVAQNGNRIKPRSKTLNLGDQRNLKESGNAKENFLNRNIGQYTSLRLGDTKKRPDKLRFSLRFPLKKSSKESTIKTDVKTSTETKRIGNYIYSYSTDSLLESDVSFHMQGSTQKSHVVLASASTIPLKKVESNDKGDVLRSRENKENAADNNETSLRRNKSFVHDGFGSKLYANKTLRPAAYDKWTVKLDATIEEECEMNIYEECETKSHRQNIRRNSSKRKSRKPTRFVQ